MYNYKEFEQKLFEKITGELRTGELRGYTYLMSTTPTREGSRLVTAQPY